MNSLEVKIDDSTGYVATYEPPQLSGIVIEDDEVNLFFDLVHSSGEELTVPLEDLVSLRLTVD